MANLSLLSVFFAIATLATVGSQNLIAPRIIDGIPADTMRRLAHHVTIQPERRCSWEGVESICGGSILNERWILTSARCVDNSKRVFLHFERLYINDTTGSYSAVVNSDAVHIYPTYYDDIALVKIPFRLIFSDIIKPINITTIPMTHLENRLAILPGFDVNGLLTETSTSTSAEQQLAYAMLKVVPNSQCKQYYQSGFDEYLQLCAISYGNSPNAPCRMDYGSALITGWPAYSEIVGIYSSTSHGCDSSIPSAYTYVAKYMSWIQSLINS